MTKEQIKVAKEGVSMEITNPEFFFTNYVGYTPDDEKKYRDTKDMIGHYVDSGMRFFLADIYETCAKDECLNARNIPKHLWKDGNLLDEGAFYMHPVLTIMSRSPEYDTESGEFIEYPYYRENVEFFSMDEVISYAYERLPSSMIRSEKEDAGAVRYMLKKYAPLKEKGIQPLDMILFLFSAQDGNFTKLLDVMEGEEDILRQIMSYKFRLEDHDRFRIVWRGGLNE